MINDWTIIHRSWSFSRDIPFLPIPCSCFPVSDVLMSSSIYYLVFLCINYPQVFDKTLVLSVMFPFFLHTFFMVIYLKRSYNIKVSTEMIRVQHYGTCTKYHHQQLPYRYILTLFSQSPLIVVYFLLMYINIGVISVL